LPPVSVLAALRNKGCTRPDVSIGDSPASSAISEDFQSGFMSEAPNVPGLVPCSPVKSTEPSIASPISETSRKAPCSLLVESSTPAQRSPTAFETTWSSRSPTPLLSTIAILVATVGFFIFAAVWPIFTTLFPVFARLRCSPCCSSPIGLRSESADFLAVSENSCDPLLSVPSNVRRSLPRLVVEPTEQISIPPDLVTRPEVAPALFADSSIADRTREPRLTDPRAQNRHRVTRITDTISESATRHGTVFVVTKPPANPRTYRYGSRSPLNTRSPIRPKGFVLEETSFSAISSASSVLGQCCDNLLSTIPIASNPSQSSSAISEDFRVKLAPDAPDSRRYSPDPSVESLERQYPSPGIATNHSEYPRTDCCDRRDLPKTRSPTRLNSSALEETSSPATPPVPSVFARLRDHFLALPLVSIPGSSYSPIPGDSRSELAPGVSGPRRSFPHSSIASPEPQIASPAMSSTRESAHLLPVDSCLVADSPPLDTQSRYPVARETTSYPLSPTDPSRRRTPLVVVTLLAFAVILLFFTTVPRVFADVPSLSVTALADSFISAQFFVATSSSVDVLSIGDSLDIFGDWQSLGEPFPGDISRDNLDLETFGLRFQTHLVRIDLEDWRTIGFPKSSPYEHQRSDHPDVCRQHI
jgi:hypothetical protein